MPETITFEGRSVYAVCPEEYDEMVAELERLRAAQPAVPDDVDLFRFMRDALRAGAAIEAAHAKYGYETVIAHIEAEATNRETALRAMLAASQRKEGA